MRITLNTDKILVKEIQERLKANDNYCPCRLVRTPDTKCMCKEFRDMMTRGEAGLCHCGLYMIEL